MLTGFQFRVSRAILDLYYEQLASSVGLHFGTLKRIEEETPNLSPIKSQLSTVILLTNFFNTCGVFFPSNNIVTINGKEYTTRKSPSEEITRFQLKGGRVAIKLTQKELGEYINVAQSTLSDLEIKYKNEQFIKFDSSKSRSIRSFFLQYGITFPSPTSIELSNNHNLVKDT
jgi:DNA-binding XRE family transcriptional regulator